MATRQKVRPKINTKLSSTSSRNSSTKSSETSSTTGQKSTVSKQAIVPGRINTVIDSMLLMKRLLASSVSAICHARGVFSPDCFIEKKLPDGSTVKVLTSSRDGEPNGKAIRLIQMLQGAFDALDKKYLREFNFGITTDPENPNAVKESYSYTFVYDQDGTPSVSMSSGRGSGTRRVKKISYAKVKRSVVTLMHRVMAIVSSMEPISADHEPHLSVKLHYYDERTPPDYEPMGFAPTDVHEFTYTSPVITEMMLGNVGTDFHDLGMAMRSATRASLPMENMESRD